MKHIVAVGKRRTSSKETEAKVHVQVEVIENLKEYQDGNLSGSSQLPQEGRSGRDHIPMGIRDEQTRSSINPVGEVHQTSCHLAHSSLFDDDSGCIL